MARDTGSNGNTGNSGGYGEYRILGIMGIRGIAGDTGIAGIRGIAGERSVVAKRFSRRQPGIVINQFCTHMEQRCHTVRFEIDTAGPVSFPIHAYNPQLGCPQIAYAFNPELGFLSLAKQKKTGCEHLATAAASAH